MQGGLIARAAIASAVVWVAGGVAHTWADPIVYYNNSRIGASAEIMQNGTGVVRDGHGSGELPTTGAWAMNVEAAVNQLGASAQGLSAFDISISSNLFSGSGRSSSSAATGDASGAIVALGSSSASLGVLFRVTEPMAYHYTARLVGDGYLTTSLWQVDPASGLPSAQLFYESFLGGDRILAYSGGLTPGSYFFGVGALNYVYASPLPQSSTSAFESARFVLSPAAAIPEPATLLLVGSGLAGCEFLRGRRRRTR